MRTVVDDEELSMIANFDTYRVDRDPAVTARLMAREIIERRAKERSLMEAVYNKLGDHGGGCPEDAT